MSEIIGRYHTLKKITKELGKEKDVSVHINGADRSS